MDRRTGPLGLWCVMVFVCLLVWPGTPSQGGQRTEDPSESMVRKIARDLRCAVCQNQSVYESNSDLAKDILAIIRDKVLAGESEADIRHYFFQRYGDYIYLEPTQEGANRILWVAPFLGLILGGAALWRAITHWKAADTDLPETEEAGMPMQEAPTQETKDRIQKALERVQL